MRKLKLQVESLAVESFEPASRGAPERGTVRGHGHTQDPCVSTRENWETCQVSCMYACFPSEEPSCWC